MPWHTAARCSCLRDFRRSRCAIIASSVARNETRVAAAPAIAEAGRGSGGRSGRPGRPAPGRVVVAVGARPETSSSVLPEVSPFVQSWLRLRLKNMTRPLGSVRAAPRGSCSPASARGRCAASCTMAGSRPSPLSQSSASTSSVSVHGRISHGALLRRYDFRSGMAIGPLWNTLAASAPSTSASREQRGEVLRRAGAAGGHQRHVARGAHGQQLRQIIAPRARRRWPCS